MSRRRADSAWWSSSRDDAHRWARRSARVAALLVLFGLLGCQTVDQEDEPLPILQLETVRHLRLVSGSADGLASSVLVTIVVQPTDPLPLEILGVRPEGQDGDDAFLEIQVKWTDFLGTAPISYGRSFRSAMPFGADGEASREVPFERTFTVAIDPPEGRVLARRIEAWARLHPVDVLAAGSRSGGARLDFPTAHLETWRHVPDGSLEDLLAETDPAPDPADLFLAAVSSASGGEPREEVIEILVGALPTLAAERREPLYGALQYLTGETQGRSVYRWQSWLEQRQASRR